jgi:ATP-binding protein involved in chromosome partitioning
LSEYTSPESVHSTGKRPDTPAARQSGGKGLPARAKVNVKHVILILSGKGGVGKSTVAVNLAMALSAHGYQTGILDLDIHGPNIAKMLGFEGRQLELTGGKIQPIPITGNLSAISMASLLPDPSSPVIWRGPMKMTAIRQFLEEVNWGELDFLVVDLPPGTGDEALSIIQLAPNVSGAVIVTTPQDVSTIDASKAVKFIEKMEVPILGIIENMSGMVCPHCGGEIDLFGKGGGRKVADDMKITYLGAIPIDPEMVKSGDEGRPFILRHTGSPAWIAIDKVMEQLVRQVEIRQDA